MITNEKSSHYEGNIWENLTDVENVKYKDSDIQDTINWFIFLKDTIN